MYQSPEKSFLAVYSTISDVFLPVVSKTIGKNPFSELLYNFTHQKRAEWIFFLIDNFYINIAWSTNNLVLGPYPTLGKFFGSKSLKLFLVPSWKYAQTKSPSKFIFFWDTLINTLWLIYESQNECVTGPITCPKCEKKLIFTRFSCIVNFDTQAGNSRSALFRNILFLLSPAESKFH